MAKFNLARKLFDLEESDSEASVNSVIYLSSDEEEGTSSTSWDSDRSTDTEAIIARIEREVKSSPILIAGRKMTVEEQATESAAGPSNLQMWPPSTPKLGFKHFDEKLLYAPMRKAERTRMELCNTILPVLESPLSLPEHERGPSQDELMKQPVSTSFHASYHIQQVQPYSDLSKQLGRGCMVCGRSVDEIKQEKVNWYMSRSTPRNEPAYITDLRREAYENGLHAGSLLFLAPAVSQAAACDGTRITTTTNEKEAVPGTLPTF